MRRRLCTRTMRNTRHKRAACDLGNECREAWMSSEGTVDSI
ncbi:hypothetical protein GQ600_7525 [Phytophthora cactorum]|nr:hypothetical protein GQ600_7525 [Phytophthora cactorum]